MTVFLFIIGCLATYRLTVLLVRDACPWDICKRLRKITRLSKLLSCPYCTSLWVGAVTETAYYLSGIRDIPVVAVCLVFAFSAIAVILDRTFSSDYQT